MPRMSTTAEEATAPLVLNTDPDGLDDIPDPVTPPPVQAAIDAERQEVAACAATVPGLETLQPEILRVLDSAMWKFSEHVTTCMKHLDGGFSKAIDRLIANREGLEALAQSAKGAPYAATVTSHTPSGFPCALTVQGTSQAELENRLVALLGFLKANEFTA